MTNEIKDKVSKVKNSILERIKGHGDSDKKGKGAGNDGAQKDGVPKDTEGDGKNTSDQKATEVNENNTSDQNATGNDGQNTTESGTGGKNGTEDQVNTLYVELFLCHTFFANSPHVLNRPVDQHVS